MSIIDAIPTVKTCFFCISLKMGSILIGFINILFSLDGVFGYSSTQAKNCSGVIFIIFGIIFYVIAAFVILTSMLMIYGIIMEDMKYIKWFLWFSILNMLIQLVYGTILLVYVITGRCWSSIGMVLTSAAVVGVGVYWLMVVNSYRKEQTVLENS